jgi:hypothetical protein
MEIQGGAKLAFIIVAVILFAFNVFADTAHSFRLQNAGLGFFAAAHLL